MIRPLAPADLEQIVELSSDLSAPWAARVDRAWFEGELRAGQGVGLFFDELVAMLFYRVGPDIIEITFLMTSSTVSRRGLMKKLFSHYLAEIAQGMPTWLEVHEANQPALSFYLDLGFVERGRRERYYPDGGAAIALQLG